LLTRISSEARLEERASCITASTDEFLEKTS
jgi:hypothetical protein